MDECIIKTLSYFDIFDYPLTFTEIKKYLCCKIDSTDDELYDVIRSIPVVQESEGYYYLLGRSKIAQMRAERNSISVGKHAKAQVIAKILSFIPTIEYIGISGSLSMNNAAVSDDIDLFFITKKNSLWLSRIAVNTILSILKQKRSRITHETKDKICPNMFMPINKLSFNSKKRTLYIAHEIVHLSTIFDRGNSHGLLMYKNKWIQEFFPNIVLVQTGFDKRSTVLRIIEQILVPFEKVSYFFQKIYMRNHRTHEIITRDKAFFHPIDRQKIILDMYELRSKRYRELYIDNFWVDRDEARFYMEGKKIRILN